MDFTRYWIAMLLFSSTVYAVPVPIYNGIIGADVTPTPAYSSGADNDLATAIQSKINNSNITVTVNNGVVTLQGTVSNSGELENMVDNITSMPNVKDIDVSQVTVPANSDVVITARVKLAFRKVKLFGDTPMASMPIKVSTVNNKVTLSGTVDSEEIATKAANIAGAVQGVVEVTSNIEVIVKKEVTTTTTTTTPAPTPAPPVTQNYPSPINNPPPYSPTPNNPPTTLPSGY